MRSIFGSNPAKGDGIATTNLEGRGRKQPLRGLLPQADGGRPHTYISSFIKGGGVDAMKGVGEARSYIVDVDLEDDGSVSCYPSTENDDGDDCSLSTSVDDVDVDRSRCINDDRGEGSSGGGDDVGPGAGLEGMETALFGSPSLPP